MTKEPSVSSKPILPSVERLLHLLCLKRYLECQSHKVLSSQKRNFGALYLIQVVPLIMLRDWSPFLGTLTLSCYCNLNCNRLPLSCISEEIDFIFTQHPQQCQIRSLDIKSKFAQRVFHCVIGLIWKRFNNAGCVHKWSYLELVR